MDFNLSNVLKFYRAWLCACLALCMPGLASAVVHSTGDGTANTTPPTNDPGWAHVALLADLSGVYLGGGWILTANHVPDRDAIIGGVVYPFVPGSRVVLETSPGVSADLAVYRILGDPGLPDLTLGTTAPAVGEPLVMIGYGWNREAALTYWDGGWGEIGGPGGATYAGYKRGSGQVVHWGANVVDGTGVPVNAGGSTSTSFYTSFDAAGGGGAVSDEAQAVVGDSGGAVFYERGGPGSGDWELAGILFTVSLYSGQPPNTAVFGTQTYSVEVAAYAAQIEAITAPTVPALPWLGAVLLVLGFLILARRLLMRRK